MLTQYPPPCLKEGRGKLKEGRGQVEEGRGEEGRVKREEGRGKRGEGRGKRAFVGGLLEEGVWNEGIFFRWLLDLKGFWKRAYFGRASGSTLYFSSNYVPMFSYKVRIPDNI